MTTAQATISVTNIVQVSDSGKLRALADLEFVIEGVSLVIHGIQIRADGDGTEVSMPKFRAPDGSWRSAVTLPEEARAPVAETVIAAGIEAGILRMKAAKPGAAKPAPKLPPKVGSGRI
jgi:stage V sporulation protein G